MLKCGVTKERPIREGQILDPETLTIGMVVVKEYEHLEGDGEILKVTGFGENEIGKYFTTKGLKEFFGDCGLVVHDSGWNATNYLRLPTIEEARQGQTVFEKI